MCTGAHDYIPVPDTARVDMVYSGPGGLAENVYHVFSADPITPEVLELIGDTFSGWEENTAKGIRSVNARLTFVKVTDLSSETGAVFSGPQSIEGTVNSQILPSNVTLSIKFNGNARGRSANGRHYWIGLTESEVLGDTVADTTVDDIINAYNTLQGTLVGNGLTLVNVSYCHDGAWRTQGLVTNVLSFSSDGIVDSQRRRLLGRGS